MAGTDSAPRSLFSGSSHATRWGPEGLKGTNVDTVQKSEAGRQGSALSCPSRLTQSTQRTPRPPSTVASACFLDWSMRVLMI